MLDRPSEPPRHATWFVHRTQWRANPAAGGGIRWLTRPPAEFVAGVLDERTTKRCIASLKNGNSTCEIQLDPCNWMYIHADGSVGLVQHASCLREAWKDAKLTPPLHGEEPPVFP